MRTPITTLAVALLITVTAAGVAWATPTEVNVRIEGRSETLFEGPIWTEGHDIQASSDTQERSCDGINPNDPQNLTPGPTGTAASVDAMSLIGETFDGQWYPVYDDYFITRWGPDSEAGGDSWASSSTTRTRASAAARTEPVAGNEVLWVYEAFAGKPLLALSPVTAGYTAGARPPTATAELGKPGVGSSKS